MKQTAAMLLAALLALSGCAAAPGGSPAAPLPQGQAQIAASPAAPAGASSQEPPAADTPPPPQNSQLKPPRAFRFISDSEFWQLSGGAGQRLLTRHSIPSQQITAWYDFSAEGADGWPHISLSGEYVMKFDRDKGRCAITTLEGEAILEAGIPAEGAASAAFSEDLTRCVVISEDKSSLYVYGADGGMLWSSEGDPALGGLYYFSASFFEGSRYIAAGAGTQDHRDYCAVIDTRGENTMLLEGSEDIVGIPNGIALRQSEFGYSNALRKGPADYIAVTLSSEGKPEAALVETPEQLPASDLVVLSGRFEHPIYSVYDHQRSVRKFFAVDSGEITAAAVIPDLPGSRLDISDEYDGSSGTLRFIPSPGGKWLAMVDDFEGVRLFPFVSADDPDRNIEDFTVPDPSFEPEPSEKDKAALRTREYYEKKKAADDLNSYLRGVLSPEDFGGAFNDTEGGRDAPHTITLVVWVTGRGAVEEALAAYTGEMPPVELREAELSLAEVQAFHDALAAIALTDGESIEPVYEQPQNRAAAYITAPAEGRKRQLIDEVKGIAQSLNIPPKNYRIYTVDASAEPTV